MPSKNVYVGVNAMDQNVFIYKLTAGTGIERGARRPAQQEGGLSVFPNPVFHDAEITGTGKSLRVYDSQGRLIRDFGAKGLKNDRVHWDASALPAGVYVIRLETAGATRQVKALVIR